MLTVILLSQCEKEIVELPSVNTVITNITTISAVCVGEITSDGGGNIQGRGICWVASNNPDSWDYRTLGSGDGSFSTTIYSFLPNTTYIVQAYAYNSKGVTYGEEKVFTTLEPVQGTFTDSRDGNTYKWIEIGNQIWMAENLNYHADSGCWIYDNNTSNAETYGRLYNWETAKHVCPDGWHLPNDDEWKDLEAYLGMNQAVADHHGLRGSGEGNYLKEAGSIHWTYHNERAINSSGFTALPSGYYHFYQESFNNMGYETQFWASTQSESKGNKAWVRELFFDYEDIYRGTEEKSYGFSVRCVKDK